MWSKVTIKADALNVSCMRYQQILRSSKHGHMTNINLMVSFILVNNQMRLAEEAWDAIDAQITNEEMQMVYVQR